MAIADICFHGGAARSVSEKSHLSRTWQKASKQCKERATDVPSSEPAARHFPHCSTPSAETVDFRLHFSDAQA